MLNPNVPVAAVPTPQAPTNGAAGAPTPVPTPQPQASAAPPHPDTPLQAVPLSMDIDAQQAQQAQAQAQAQAQQQQQQQRQPKKKGLLGKLKGFYEDNKTFVTVTAAAAVGYGVANARNNPTQSNGTVNGTVGGNGRGLRGHHE